MENSGRDPERPGCDHRLKPPARSVQFSAVFDIRDEPSDQELSPALEAARRRRLDLHEALVEVEEAISAPAPGRVHEWALAVDKKLVHLRDAFDEHIREPAGIPARVQRWP